MAGTEGGTRYVNKEGSSGHTPRGGTEGGDTLMSYLAGVEGRKKKVAELTAAITPAIRDTLKAQGITIGVQGARNYVLRKSDGTVKTVDPTALKYYGMSPAELSALPASEQSIASQNLNYGFSAPDGDSSFFKGMSDAVQGMAGQYNLAPTSILSDGARDSIDNSFRQEIGKVQAAGIVGAVGGVASEDTAPPMKALFGISWRANGTSVISTSIAAIKSTPAACCVA